MTPGPAGLKAAVAALAGEVVELRREFHRHPELGWREERTAAIVERYLGDLGLEVTRLAGTGVVGVLHGGYTGGAAGGAGRAGSQTLMLRSDMDALPITEATGLPFASQSPGVMHACGHDGHLAMLLVAAKVLSGLRHEFCGRIKFVFQPNEEEAGAAALIEAGVLDDPAVDAALAAHLWTPLPVGRVAVAAGPVMASSDYFRLVIRGRGGHGGAPHAAVDPVLCGAAVMQAVQAVQTREISVLDPTLITFCRVRAGTSPIIVPDEILLEGSLRCLHEGAAAVRAAFERVVAATCAAHRTEYELAFVPGNSLLVNDAGLVDLVAGAVEATLGRSACGPDCARMMVGEDFAEFGRRVPAALYLVGAGNAAKGACYPHHHPKFDIDETALPCGVELHVRTALAFLGREP